MVQYSILFADGDPDTAQYFFGLLRANGFNAASTSSGLEALRLYKSESPDLVVCDLDLSELDGMTLLEELKKYDPNARIIITTENANKDVITRAFRMGALDVLEQPLAAEFLVSKIRELLAREDRALEGNLRMMSLASIIQINCEERNQAQLILNRLGKEGTIFFREGDIVHAETGDLIGEEAVYALLGWEEGTFKLKMGVGPNSITINKNWSGLLLEGMRRIDESTAAWSPGWREESSLVEEQQGDPLPDRIVKAIITDRVVTSAVMCSKTGTLLAQEKSTDPEGEIRLANLLVERAETIAGYLESGQLERIVLTGPEKRYYIQQQQDDLLLLSLTKRSSAETIFELVNTIYKRYLSA